MHKAPPQQGPKGSVFWGLGGLLRFRVSGFRALGAGFRGLGLYGGFRK